MAFHTTPESLLKESMQEKLVVAEYCVNYRKGIEWGKEQEGGCLGYIAAELLFSITDTIGTIFRGNNSFTVFVGDKQRRIKGPEYTNLFVLNSTYFDNQDLPESFIKELYDNYRSPLVHNSLLNPERFLHTGENKENAFELVNGKPFVYLLPYLEITKKACKKVLSSIEEIFPKSKLSKNLLLKKPYKI